MNWEDQEKARQQRLQALRDQIALLEAEVANVQLEPRVWQQGNYRVMCTGSHQWSVQVESDYREGVWLDFRHTGTSVEAIQLAEGFIANDAAELKMAKEREAWEDAHPHHICNDQFCMVDDGTDCDWSYDW